MTAAPTTRPDRRSGAKDMLRRLRGRPDSEHEMSFNRLGFVLLTLVSVLLLNPEPQAILLLLVYGAVSVGIFIHITFDSSVSTVRRLSMIVIDNIALSSVMYGNGAYSAGFYPIYLWVIFGNGFRFGLPYLFASACASIIGFGLVVLTTPFWRDMPVLSVGLIIGLIILPAYAGQLIRKLSKAKAAAEEASRAKSYFLASVSHELRTPLTAIIGLSAHLQDSELTSDQKGMAATIATAGRSLLSLINQLLDFARLGVKGIAAEAKSFDLLELLSSVRDLMKVGADEKGLRIALHVTARTPSALMGDESHLRDVLINLMGNAVKFTETGTITVTADLQSSAGRPKLLFSVTDTGIGIEPEAQEHIFDSFRQANGTIIDRFGGTGLGLAICKQVAEALGGNIGVDSTPGEGSRFWFTAEVDVAESITSSQAGRLVLFTTDDGVSKAVGEALGGSGLSLEIASTLEEARHLVQDGAKETPAALVVDGQELQRCGISVPSLRERLDEDIAPILLEVEREAVDRMVEPHFVSTVSPISGVEEIERAFMIAAKWSGSRVRTAEQKAAQVDRAPLRVLIADDNVMNQKVFAMVLRRAGHSVQIVDDGEAALDVMKDNGVDVVLMDVNMPVLNGIEATKLYRFTAMGRRQVPIVGVTADASPETAERCLEAGMDACISKPVEAEPLLDLLDELTEVSRPTIRHPDPRGVVTPLHSVSATRAAALNWEKIHELDELGGSDFVTDLLHQYVRDVQDLLTELRHSIDAGDVETFRSSAHALRSSGANIGAEGVAEMCLHLQRIERAEFEAKGERHLLALEEELTRVRAALAARDHEPVVPAVKIVGG